MDNEIKEPKEERVAEEYLSSLADLNMNSKPLINMLTILAEENIEHAATIVKVVEAHIAKVEPDIKLPILYLIDSIVKNVKNTYIPLFSQCIVNIFCGVFEQVSEKVRERMYTLRQTWNEVFTAQKLYTLDVKVNCMDRNWPITAKVTKSPSIHVNPNFLKKNEMEATLRAKTRELLELEKRKLELELEATKKLLQEQEKQLSKQTESVKTAPEHPPQMRHPSMGAMQKPNYMGINTYQKFRNNGPRQPPPNMMNMPQMFPTGPPPPPQLLQQQKPKVHPVNPIMLNTIRQRDPRLARQQQQQQQQQHQQQQQQPPSQEKDNKSKSNTNPSGSMAQAIDQNIQASSSFRSSKSFDSRTSKRRDTDRSNRQIHDRSSRDRSVRDRSSKSRSEEEHSDSGTGARSKSTSVSSRNKRGESRTRSESKSPTRVRSSSSRSSNRSGSTSRDKERRNSSKSSSSSFDRKKSSSRSNDSKYPSACSKIIEETEQQNDANKRKTNSPAASPSKSKDSKSKPSNSLKVLKTYAGRKHKQRTPSPSATKDIDLRIIHPDKRARLASLKTDFPTDDEKTIMPPPPPSLESLSEKIQTDEDKVSISEVKADNVESVSIEIDSLIPTATSKTLDQNIEAIHSVKDVDLREFQRITSKAHQSSTSTSAIVSQSINKLEKSSELPISDNNLDASGDVVMKDELETTNVVVAIADTIIQPEEVGKDLTSNGKAIGENKRPSTDDPGEPNAKRIKPQKIDGLFGTEDVDLRTVIPTVILNPSSSDVMTPPPPPVISNEKENWAKVKGSPSIKSSPNKSSLDDVRAKLAKAARYNKMEKSQRELSQKFKIHELQDETVSEECNDSKIRTMIGQAQELLETRNINQEQYQNLVKTVMQINETNKLNAAKRLESLNSGDKAFEQTIEDAHVDPDKEARDAVHKKRIPKISKDSSSSSNKDQIAADQKESINSVDDNLQPDSRQQATGEKERRVKMSKWSAPVVQPVNNQSAHSQPQPQRQRFGPSNRPPFNNRIMLPNPWQNPSNVFNGTAAQPRRTTTTVPAPPQPPTLVIPKPCNSIDNPQEDVVRTITIDGRTKEIRFYGNVAIVFMDWDQPREIGFQPGTRAITIDNKDSIVLNFNEDYKEVTIDGEPHRMRFAFPSRELYIDEHWYEVYFGGPAMPIPINNKIHLLQAEGPPPQVHIGILRRDLVVGKINMIIDARNIIPVFLDANPQTFIIDGQQHVIEFADNLKTVIINGELLNVEYGGLPKSLMLGGRKYFVRFGTLPTGIVAGQHIVKGMKYINMQPPPEVEKIVSPILQPIKDSGSEIVATSNPGDIDLITESTVVGPNTITSSTQAIAIPGIAPILPNVNIDDLFQKLISTGIINTVANNGAASDVKNTKEEDVRVLQDVQPIKPVNLNVPETIKTRQGAIINALFCGMQCSSCGVRFPPEQTIKYSQHLDWHFRQNRRERDSARKAHSRKWYYEISDWLQYEEIEDLEDREKNFFESQQIDLENIDENSNQRTASSPIPSCPAEPGDVDRACDMCQEKFEQFYNEDLEEWHLRAAVRVEDKIYHPLCYEDYKASLNPPSPVVEEENEDQNITAITIDDDNAVDVAIVKKEKNENTEGSGPETPHIIFDDDDDDDVIVVPAEEPSITEIDDDEEYVPVNMSREEMGGVADEGVLPGAAVNETLESDVEIQEPNIPFTDLDTYEERPSAIDECSQSSMLNVKIKEEPKDDEDDDGFEDVGIVLIPEEEISIQSSDDNTGARTISSTVSTPQPSPMIVEPPGETSQPPSEDPTSAIAEEIIENEESLDGNLESNDNPIGTNTTLLGVNKIKINMTKNIVTSSNSTSNSITKTIGLNQNPSTSISNVSNISTIPVLCSGPMTISTIPLSLDSSAVGNEELSGSLYSGHPTFSTVPSFCTPISSATTETSNNVIQVITSHTTTGPSNMDSFSNCIEVIGSKPTGNGGGSNVQTTIRETATPPLCSVLKPIEAEDIEPTFTFKPELQNVKLKKVKKIDCGVEASGLCSIM